MRTRTTLATLFILLASIGGWMGCSHDDHPASPSDTRSRVSLEGGFGGIEPADPAAAACPAPTIAEFRSGEFSPATLLQGLADNLDDRYPRDDSSFAEAKVYLGNALSALRHGDVDNAHAQLGRLNTFLMKQHASSRDELFRQWLLVTVARVEFLRGNDPSSLRGRVIPWESFYQAGADLVEPTLRGKGSCLSDCLKTELEECAEALIENIGGDPEGIIKNIVENCITGAIGGCIASGPACLIGALEGCMLAISVDFIWQVSKFLCCAGASFVSCAWDCWW